VIGVFRFAFAGAAVRSLVGSTLARRPACAMKPFAFENGLVLWDCTASRLMAFNAATAAIWPMIEAGHAPGEVAAELARLYGVSFERARCDVEALLAELSRLGGWAGAPLAPEDDGVQAVDWSSSPLARLTITIAGLRLSIEADAEVIAFLRPLFHGRISAHGKADRSIRVTWPASDAVVSLDAEPRGFARSREEAIGAIYELILEAIHPDLEWLGLFHASAVARDNSALLFPAPSGSGKSTLVTSLLQDHYDYLSDDLVGVSTGDLRVWPFPLGINLKNGSRALVEIPPGFEAKETRATARRGLILAPPSDAWMRPPAPLRAVVFPRYVADAEPTLEKLAAIDALTRLLADRIHLGHPLTARRISRFLRWVERTPFYALIYGDLASAKALIEGLLP
jgi:hypothetical protein